MNNNNAFNAVICLCDDCFFSSYCVYQLKPYPKTPMTTLTARTLLS